MNISDVVFPRVSPRQRQVLQGRIPSDRWHADEQLWTFFVAALIAEAPQRYIPLFCGEALSLPDGGVVVCEAEPISTRIDEGNTVLDIAFGHIGVRSIPASGNQPAKDTIAGIAYAPRSADAWVCFLEAKCLSDCDCKVTNDPLRNQLTRVVENLLCFQANGQFPARLQFALLTPHAFRESQTSRLYGYKFRDYQNREAVLKSM